MPLNTEKQIISALSDKMSQKQRYAHGDRLFRNSQIATEASEIAKGNFATIFSLLERNNALHIATEKHELCDIDGAKSTVLISRAAATNMAPMGTHFWVRDNAIIAARLLGLNEFSAPSPYNRALGLELLLSALTLLSTQSQLERFQAIIANPELADEAHNWPFIFLHIESNLNAARTEPWMHIQDAWQITAFYVLQALELGLITYSSFHVKQKHFLHLIIPFLAKIAFASRENAGSWEELIALRSSVLSWEVALLHRLHNVKDSTLQQDLENSCQQHLGQSAKQAISELLAKGLHVLHKQLPHESPAYKSDDPRYREADAALLYTLQLRIPEVLAMYGIMSNSDALTLEKTIFEQVLSLQDAQTGAIRRYRDDSYQRIGYFRPSTLQKLQALYGGASAEYSGAEDFRSRDAIVPQGREAAWVHFVWQAAAYANRKFLQTHDNYWQKAKENLFLDALSLVTGENEYSLQQTSQEFGVEIIAVPAFRIPECYLSEQNEAGTMLFFPSPHTPLNWAIAEAIDALLP